MPVVKTCTTVPVVVSTSAIASRTSTPVIRLIVLPQLVEGVAEQLPVKLLHLGSALGALGQGPLGRRQRPVQGDQQSVPAEDHGHRLGLVTRSLLLEGACRLCNLLGYARIELFHRTPLRSELNTFQSKNKKADVAAHPKVFHHVGLPINEPPSTAGLLPIWSSDNFVGQARPIGPRLVHRSNRKPAEQEMQ